MSVQVKVKLQTRYDSKPALPGDILEVEISTAKRWHSKGIAVMKKADVKKLLGAAAIPKKPSGDFVGEPDAEEEPDEFNSDTVEEKAEVAEEKNANANANAKVKGKTDNKKKV